MRSRKREHEFILCNYANGDMVGHTGSLPATIKAVETVDACLARVLKAAESSGTPDCSSRRITGTAS